MLEAESGLGQNIKVVGNGIRKLPVKFHLNPSTVACYMTKIPLSAKCFYPRTVLRYHISGFVFHFDPYQISI